YSAMNANGPHSPSSAMRACRASREGSRTFRASQSIVSRTSTSRTLRSTEPQGTPERSPEVAGGVLGGGFSVSGIPRSYARAPPGAAQRTAEPERTSELTLRLRARGDRRHPRDRRGLLEEVGDVLAQDLHLVAVAVGVQRLGARPLLDHRDRAVLGVVDRVELAA